jgi:polysaccharide export outer membrane protein
VILDTLGVAEETPVAWEQAQDPKPIDTVITESDYALRSGDVVRVSIFELLQEGVQFDNEYVVTETGKLSIPEVGVVEAAGLTETQLEEEIRRILSPSVLKEPSVVVTLLSSQQRTFSVLGDGVPAPGRYVIPRYGFRLTDALATAGGPRQFNVSYIYISRYAKEKEQGELELPEFKEPGLQPVEPGELELLTPEAAAPGVTKPKAAKPRIPGLETTEVTVPEITESEVTVPEITLPEITGPGIAEPELTIPETSEPEITVPEEIVEPELEMPEIITPRAQRQWPQSRVVITSSEMITDRELAQATFPQGFERPSPNGRRTNGSTRSTTNSFAEQINLKPTDEAIQDESVSVRDILKSLSERSRRGQTTAAGTPPTDLVAPAEEPSVTTEEPPTIQTVEELPALQRISAEDVRTPPAPAPQRKINGSTSAGEIVRPSPVAPPTAGPKVNEQSKVDDILKRLSERRRPEKVEEAVPEEGITKPLPEPTLPQVSDEEINVDEILKSLSQRRTEREKKVEEVEEIVKPVEEPVAPQRVKERIDVDEILKMLEEQPGREKSKVRVKQPIGIEEAIEAPAEPVIPEIPEEPVGVEEIVAPEPTPSPVAPGETAVEEEGRIEWIFQNGKWVPVQVGPEKRIEPVIKFEPNEGLIVPLEEKPVPPEVEWAEAAKTRLIRIPADKLLAGDPRYNIVIKPGDTVHVPVDIIGEFCIMGNVNSQGYVNITGRPMTLKMAIAAAGGLGPLAWPKKCEVVRRIGRKKEEIVMVDLDRIASGELPDFFIKPNDLVNVGTHATSMWRAVLRNSFRATYGFGFVYDRNFADVDFYTRGTRWF